MAEALRGGRPAGRRRLGRQDLFRVLVEGASEVIARFDGERRYLYANAPIEGLLGLAPEALLGRRNAELGLPAELVEPWDAAIAEALAAGEERLSELELPTPQGPRWYQLRVAPDDARRGAPQSVLVVARDVSDRKRIERELRRRSDDLVERFKEMHCLYAVLRTLEGGERDLGAAFDRIVRLIPEGWQYPQITRVRLTVEGRSHATDGFRATPWMQAVPILCDGVSVGSLEVCYIEERPEQDRGPFLWEEEQLLESIGERIGAALSRARVERERRELEDQLRHAQKMEAIGRLAGGMAHDFNNVLTAIVFHADAILLGLPADNPMRSRVESIKNAGKQASTLTAQLLAFGARRVLELRVFDLDQLAADTETPLRRLLGEDIELVSRRAVRPAWIEADRAQIEQVILHLAINAREAMPEGGTLTLETAVVDVERRRVTTHATISPGSYARLTVADTGCGMDRETQSRIFEPFFTTKGRGRWSGLGLSTVYGIVEQCGGHVVVESAPDRGARFEVYLPSAVVPQQEADGEGEEAVPEGGQETILVAEDDEGVRGVVVEALRRVGYTVLEAATGQEALALATGHRGTIDLVLMDIVMPDLRGYAAEQRLRASRPQVKLLYMSGYAETTVGRRATLPPRASFLAKPFTTEALLRKVREVLAA